MIRVPVAVMLFVATSCACLREGICGGEEEVEESRALGAFDYARAGISKVRSEEGAWPAEEGKAVDYAVFRPEELASDVWVILGHGFLRDKETMEHLARNVASHGVAVATLDFRHSRPWAGGHRKNAADMRGLARHLGAEKVIYAGFSAGGLSALMAAAADGRAVGYLGLDMVDNGEGAAEAEGIGFPLDGLVGLPSGCNAGGNGKGVYAAAVDARVISVAGASHCHFEFPLDGACRFLCGGEKSDFSDGEIQAVVVGLATASLVRRAGVAPEAGGWWEEGGVGLGMLEAEERVAALELE